ncbi:MAG: OadG family protein [Clostridiales bacterium]|nr:OadG family protein [Clostridiales bacterium]
MSTFSTAVFNTLIGLCTVFVVLIVISLIISLFKYIPALEMKMKNLTSGSKKKSSEEERKPPQRPVIVEEEPEEEEELVDDGELVAVIMAAIVASSGGAVSADKLVVRSIRRMKRNR